MLSRFIAMADTLILEKMLELVLKEGARIAQPGEFTKRAFLNGRIDLTQAEAVIDLIRSRTMAGLDVANQQLRGMLFKEMMSLKETLVDHLALIEAHIDFPEEEIESVSLKKLQDDLTGMVEKLEEWIASYEEGKMFVRESLVPSSERRMWGSRAFLMCSSKRKELL